MRLAIFDVDGTISDSQHHILAAMDAGFAAIGRAAPPRAQVLGIVGLSLPVAIAELAPDLPDAARAQIVAAYAEGYGAARRRAAAPLYPGAKALLERLAGQGVTLAIATGKSRRGLDALLAHHGLGGLFASTQVADDHPSKPHPSMIAAVLAATGCPAGRAVMIGDTRYDIEMARAAGVPALGVGWGYHPAEDLAAAGARAVVTEMGALEAALGAIWEAAA